MSRVEWRPHHIVIIFLTLTIEHKQAANVGGSGQNELKVETTTSEVTTSRGLLVSGGPVNFTVQSGTRVTLHCRVELQDENASCSWATVRKRSGNADRDRMLRCRKDSELTVCLMEEGSIDPTLEQPRVVIVGAGMAGLSAANRLLQCGVDNFVVLEATDRPGGRIHTCAAGKTVFDLGSNRIYGTSPMNPIHTLAAREGLLENATKVNEGRGICLTSSGVPAPTLVETTAHHSIELILKQAAELLGKSGAARMSLWDFVNKRIQQEVEVYPRALRAFAARKMYGLSNDLRNVMGADLSDAALDRYAHKIEGHGPQVSILTGMIGLLAPLLRPMPTCDHILYCKQVEKIIWSGSLNEKPGRVNIVCCDATIYPADYVIVTLPLGVLKEKASTMFEPGLSDEKNNAINKLGFGNICRIALEYERPFWVWQHGKMLFGWSLPELKSRKACPDWVKAIGTVEETAGTQQGLSFSVAGKEADIAESLSDVQIAEDFTRVLRRFTGDQTLPYPANVYKSAWGSNRYSRGAKPYFSTESTLGHLCEVAMPMPEETKGVPAVLFAGDCACPDGVGSLQAARLSGVREADRILRLTKKLEGRPRPDVAEAEVCKVSWLKRKGDSLHLLSVNMEVFKDDPRYRINFIKPVDWQLYIQPVNHTDQGYYECQVSSHPPIVHSVFLHVVEKDDQSTNSEEKENETESTTESILTSTVNMYIYLDCEENKKCPETTTPEDTESHDGQGFPKVEELVPELEIRDERNIPIKNKFYNSGSTIELRCLILKVPTPTQFIMWKHNSSILNYDTTRGGISVKTDILPDGGKSQLYIANVGPTDSGNYSCSLGEETVTWVSVVVITGETPAAMQHGSATAVNVGLLTILSAAISALS